MNVEKYAKLNFVDNIEVFLSEELGQLCLIEFQVDVSLAFSAEVFSWRLVRSFHALPDVLLIPATQLFYYRFLNKGYVHQSTKNLNRHSHKLMLLLFRFLVLHFGNNTAEYFMFMQTTILSFIACNLVFKFPLSHGEKKFCRSLIADKFSWQISIKVEKMF